MVMEFMKEKNVKGMYAQSVLMFFRDSVSCKFSDT